MNPQSSILLREAEETHRRLSTGAKLSTVSEPHSCENKPQAGYLHEMAGFNFAQINDDPKLQSTVSNKKLSNFLPRTTDQKRSHSKVKPNSIALQQSLNPILTKPKDATVSD